MKKQSNTEKSICLRIVLVAPPSGVDFGIQEGKGNDYKTIQVQRSKDSDLQFECNVGVKANRDDGPPNFVGNIVQGPPLGRFIYIDIGNQSSWWTWMESWLPSFARAEAITKRSNRSKANGNFSEPN